MTSTLSIKKIFSRQFNNDEEFQHFCMEKYKNSQKYNPNAKSTPEKNIFKEDDSFKYDLIEKYNKIKTQRVHKALEDNGFKNFIKKIAREDDIIFPEFRKHLIKDVTFFKSLQEEYRNSITIQATKKEKQPITIAI